MTNCFGKWDSSLARFACVLFLLLALFPITGVGEIPATEEELKKSMGLEGYALVYELQDGTEITFEQFVELAKSGDFPGFGTELPEDQKQLTLTLLPAAEFAASDALEELAVATGEKMPVLNLPDLAGMVYDYEDFGNKPLLISFYFSLCPPCIKEIPELNEFARENPQVAVVAVTFNSADEARLFADKYGFDWRIIPDAQGFIDQVGVSTYPAMALVSADGILIAARIGEFATNPDEPKVESGWLKAWVDEALLTGT